MEQYVYNNISAGQFLEQRYKLGDKYYDNYLAPVYSHLVELIETNKVYEDAETMNYVYSRLKGLYNILMVDITHLLTRSNTTEFHRREDIDSCTYQFSTLVTRVLSKQVLLEPATKLFFEDLFGLLYRDKNISILQHGYIISKPMKDYRTGNRGLEIRVDDLNKEVILELPKLLKTLGLKNTLGLIHILISIWLNLIIFPRADFLNGLLRPVGTWRMPLIKGGATTSTPNNNNTGTANGNPPEASPSIIVPIGVTPTGS